MWRGTSCCIVYGAAFVALLSGCGSQNSIVCRDCTVGDSSHLADAVVSYIVRESHRFCTSCENAESRRVILFDTAHVFRVIGHQVFDLPDSLNRLYLDFKREHGIGIHEVFPLTRRSWNARSLTLLRDSVRFADGDLVVYISHPLVNYIEVRVYEVGNSAPLARYYVDPAFAFSRGPWFLLLYHEDALVSVLDVK